MTRSASDLDERNEPTNLPRGLKYELGLTTGEIVAPKAAVSARGRFRGVVARGSKWTAAASLGPVRPDGRRGRIYIGIFATAEEAARAYDRVAVEALGPLAPLNFPDPDSQARTLQSASVVKVPLGRSGKYAIVDADDAVRVLGRRWIFKNERRAQGYVYSASGSNQWTTLSKFILGDSAPAHSAHRNGDLLDFRRSNLCEPIDLFEKRFWSKVEPGEPPAHVPELGHCLLWTGNVSSGNGYGLLKGRDGKRERAHRIAWLLHHKEMPKGIVMHRCDNPPCVRIEHLLDGTTAKNNWDKIKKGRDRSPKGATHARPKAKLTGEQVLLARRDVARGDAKKAVAAKYGISPSALQRIVSGKSWSHLPLGTPERDHDCEECGGAGHAPATTGLWPWPCVTCPRCLGSGELRADGSADRGGR